MKLFGLLLMLGLISVMTAMLTAMSADASARLSLSDKPRLVAPTATAADAQSVGMTTTSLTQQTATTSAPETPRKKTKKRSRAKCARITGTCWGSA